MFSDQDKRKCNQLLEKYYKGRSFSDARYRAAIRQHVETGALVLDAGCGSHLTFSREISAFARVVGFDLERSFETDNSAAPFAVRADVARLPFPDGRFDAVVSRSVIEHLRDPRQAFRELSRVLRPGGTLMVVTPNKYDYVSLLAAVTPHWLHRAFVSRVFGVSENDVFPTYYRANTVRALRRVVAEAGFVERSLETIAHYPAYLSFSPLLFRAGVLYERFTSLPVGRSLRGSILGVWERAASPSATLPGVCASGAAVEA
jgi:SAM-dependent methyltransferase